MPYKFYLVAGLSFLSLVHSACGTYEYRKRPDQSEVAVIREIQNVFPEFANEVSSVLDGLKVQQSQIEGSVAHAELKNHIVRLYQQKDQLNAQLRDFVVARYQSYINAELDADKAAREKGRAGWNEVTAKVQLVALELRKLKQSIDDKIRQQTEAKEKSKKSNEKKAKAKIEISEAGFTIQKFAEKAKVNDPALRSEVAKVIQAKHVLDTAIEQNHVVEAKDQVHSIWTGLNKLSAPIYFEGEWTPVEKAKVAGKVLEVAILKFEESVEESQLHEKQAEQNMKDLAEQIKLSIEKIKSIGAILSQP